jgi:hypothetical protein
MFTYDPVSLDRTRIIGTAWLETVLRRERSIEIVVCRRQYQELRRVITSSRAGRISECICLNLFYSI